MNTLLSPFALPTGAGNPSSAASFASGGPMSEKIKNEIIDLIHRHEDVEFNKKLSVLLQEKLHMDYHYLSTLFSSIEGVTIEKYAILQKIERAKELLVAD